MHKPLLIFFYCFLLLTAQNVSAQKIRFTDTSNNWRVLGCICANNPYPSYSVAILKYSNDTIVNGLRYRRVGDNINAPCIREDGVTGKVYVKYYLSDTEDRVLFDYSLKLADTFINFLKPYGGKIDTHVYAVAKFDSTLLNGTYHRFWWLHNVGGSGTWGMYQDYKVIEGVGCTDGMFFPLDPMFFEASSWLSCFSNSTGVVTIADTSVGYKLNDSTCKQVGIATISAKEYNAVVYPNPANANSIARLPYKIREGVLIITNAYGQVVLNKKFENKEELPLNNVDASGMYFYRITDRQTNQTFTGKFIYQ